MNDEDISQFLQALSDFLKHAEVEEAHYNSREQYSKYRSQSQQVIHNEIEKKAAELKVSIDYYLAEFT